MTLNYTKKDNYYIIHIKYNGAKMEKGVYDCYVSESTFNKILNINRALFLMKNTGNGTPYAMYKLNNKNLYVHHLVHPVTQGCAVDHINKNTLDNRDENLRIVPRHHNNRNTDYVISNKYGYKWATKNKNKFACNVRHLNKKKYLGNFGTALEAHRCGSQWVNDNIGSEFRCNDDCCKDMWE